MPTRRELLLSAASLGLTACENQAVQDILGAKEGLRDGNILVTPTKAELLRLNQRFLIPNLETFLRRAKYKGKIVKINNEELQGLNSTFPEGKSFKDYQFAIGQGDLKRLNPKGGEKLIYAQGFLSSDSRPYTRIIPREDTFVAVRRRLKEDGWDAEKDLWLDSYIFTYSESELEDKELSIGKTLKDPGKVKTYARTFIGNLLEKSPLEQNNGFGHSLGGIYIREMAEAYPDAFNNLIFINSPIMGLNLNPLQRLAVEILKENVNRLGVDPTKVIDYLTNLWNDEYHNKVKKFMDDFTKRGGRVLIVYTKGDVIVPKESTGADDFKDIKGVEILEVDAGNVDLLNPIAVFNAHGLALSAESVLNKSEQMVGHNLWNA